MTKNYPELIKDISANSRKIRKAIPDTMAGFSQLAREASKDGALSAKTKEMIAVAIAIATRCDGCIGYHVEALVKLGCTFEEFNEVLGMTIYLGGGPSLMYAADAVAAFEQFSAAEGRTVA
ncbi:carboxymuconolactone decarboxylase family protein [Rhizobium sp. C4]|uniref:carboxymuconolactone decarboxylase family protein n=1 Tax=Rhizobium sp. C4 TaxID=1349800 RepID=UPI001E394167|nr:carboxymuconolactone decarboxylase family protein [Rhizobium sp. C4]MCD2175541.1 carboxymuconolactone decarboxylase family protein [Rhizobium sp. C4]